MTAPQLKTTKHLTVTVGGVLREVSVSLQIGVVPVKTQNHAKYVFVPALDCDYARFT